MSMDIPSLYSLILKAKMAISTDTRTIAPGDIYIGLKGDNFDGNAYAKDALAKGAAYALIDNPIYKESEQYIVVENTYKTLEALATTHRMTFSIPILVIGGSNGKTTTKELVHAVLATHYRVHTTKGNLNNTIGVPLTLLAMPKDTEIAVIEIGANHPGEHIELMNVVRPTHILVTNNGADHLEGFGSLEGVRKANKEIFDCALAQNATAFVNKELSDLVKDSSAMKRTLYPEDTVQSIPGIQAGIVYAGTPIHSQLFGSFNEANIAAAIAVGKTFNISMEHIAQAVAAYEPSLKRSQIIEKNGYTIILDCYNANPTSMTLALNSFFESSTPKKRVIVVGDMFEVGETEMQAHKEILELIKSRADANDEVICVGPRFSTVFSGHQPSFSTFHFFPTPQEAKPFFESLDLSDKKIFLKASRGIKLEGILE